VDWIHRRVGSFSSFTDVGVHTDLRLPRGGGVGRIAVHTSKEIIYPGRVLVESFHMNDRWRAQSMPALTGHASLDTELVASLRSLTITQPIPFTMPTCESGRMINLQKSMPKLLS